MKLSSLLFFLAVCASPVNAQQGLPHQLTPSDRAVVEQAVKDETADPDRARVSGIVAAISADGVITACGYLRWLDGSGLYGPHRPFSGILATNTHGQRVFVVVGIARTDRDQEITEMLCARYGAQIPAGAESVPQSTEPPLEVARLIEVVRDLDRRCRGTEGADPSSLVCADRDAAFEVVFKAGWCYGREGEYMYQKEWHPCAPGSGGYRN